ncbi:hypothetical protein DR864_28395 (plasmid) [Runella rosea]|uniref:Aminoglycoside phosphotransferase domain-containing protein n=1 Tax=Runella rosea TaxID=2259595 RepID=A0A344TT25_9BACT|nr:phosphotransferase [Runella rosea]AXE21796.1 hypothetical protein DR864_28395 [Runella rosea]
MLFLEDVFSYHNFGSICDSIPKFYAYDATNQIIITEYKANSISFKNLIGKSHLSVLFSEVGFLLTVLHQLPMSERTKYSSFVPWFFTEKDKFRTELLLKDLNQTPILDDFDDFNFFEIIRSCEHIWQNNCYVHGDLKLDNILFQRTSKKIYLTDWETFGMGDALWDLSFLLSQLITSYVIENKLILLGRFIPLDSFLDNGLLLRDVRSLLKSYDLSESQFVKLNLFTAVNIIIYVLETIKYKNLGLKSKELVGLAKRMISEPHTYISIIK